MSYGEEDVAISEYPLSAALTCAKVCSAFEEVWNINWSKNTRWHVCCSVDNVCFCFVSGPTFTKKGYKKLEWSDGEVTWE